MTVTKELVNLLVPTHDRSSCDDANLTNAYGGWSGMYNQYTGEKEVRHPRCVRCYLLNNLGMNLDDLEFKVEVALRYKA